MYTWNVCYVIQYQAHRAWLRSTGFWLIMDIEFGLSVVNFKPISIKFYIDIISKNYRKPFKYFTYDLFLWLTIRIKHWEEHFVYKSDIYTPNYTVRIVWNILYFLNHGIVFNRFQHNFLIDLITHRLISIDNKKSIQSSLYFLNIKYNYLIRFFSECSCLKISVITFKPIDMKLLMV